MSRILKILMLISAPFLLIFIYLVLAVEQHKREWRLIMEEQPDSIRINNSIIIIENDRSQVK